MGINKRYLSLKDIGRFERHNAKTVIKLNQKCIDTISKDKNVFGHTIKGIDMGRLSDEEYDKLCIEKAEKMQGWSI